VQTIRVFPSWIVIGKVNSQVAFAKSAENRVGYCMQQNVGIRVPVAPSIGRDPHTAQHKRPTFNQPVCVVADANPEHGQ
jgi:hypothetical protein